MKNSPNIKPQQFLSQDNKRLQEENRTLVRENSRHKEEPKFSKSPQR